MSAVANSMNPPAEITESVAQAPAKKAGSKRMIGLGLLVVALSGAAGWYVMHHGLESTDDAQVDGDVVSIPSRTSGVVTSVHFVENQVVKKGDLLAEIDAEPARARLAQADAALDVAKASADAADAEERVAESDAQGNHSVAQATLRGATSTARATKDQIAEGEAQVAVSKANLAKAKTDLDRARKLLETNAIPQAQLDQTQSAFDAATASRAQADAHLASLRASTTQAMSHVDEASARVRQTGNVAALIDEARARARAARAQVATAQAARDLAALDLSYTKIVAPEDGIVSKKTVAVGQMLSPGQGIVQLIPQQQTWVTANFKETQLTKMHVGQPATIEVDAFPGLELHGEVQSFSAATGARFALLPPDNATGNFTKVVQRVPVRVRLKDVPQDLLLRPGMSVNLTVDARK